MASRRRRRSMRGGPFRRRGAGAHFCGEGLRGGQAVAVPDPALVRPTLDALPAFLALPVDAPVRHAVLLAPQARALIIAALARLCAVRALVRYTQSAVFGTK